MSTQAMQQTIAEYFKTQPVLKAWLFGSYARGEERPGSDVDILFVPDYNAGKPWSKFGTIVAMDEKTLDVDDVDILPITVLTNGNQLTVTVSGTEVGEEITVYDMAGMIVGSAKATSQTTTIRTTLQKGETGIVKIGEKRVKVVVKK